MNSNPIDDDFDQNACQNKSVYGGVPESRF